MGRQKPITMVPENPRSAQALRNTSAENPRSDTTDSSASWEHFSGRGDPEQRFQLRRSCVCATCDGQRTLDGVKCPDCRGEGRTMELVATAGTPEALGVALVSLGREGEFEECLVGILDTLGKVGEKWILRPWLPSPRNLSDAGRVLASASRKGKR